MGNDIARQFGHVPEEQAITAIATHIDAFWDPRMKRALLALVAQDENMLDPLLVAAAARLPPGTTPS
jgi:formate dehydrogenase subunit delta